MIKALRTPENRFKDLPGFDFSSAYIDNMKGYEGLRMHYVDEGPKQAENVFLCLHGQPTWSYLYRKMIPIFSSENNRVIAPDLFGFGRSDKPVDEAVYTFDFHRNSLLALIESLNLNNITLVCQDWGGILGLTLPMSMADRFSRLLVMNTTLGTGDYQLPEAFFSWRDWVRKPPDISAGDVLKLTCPHLSAQECAAYDAPFPDITYKAGVRRFPEMVPTQPEAPGAQLSQDARKWLKNEWTGPVFMAIGVKDPVLGPQVMKGLQGIIQNCPDPFEYPEAGHFVQEWGDKVARQALLSFDG